MIHDGKSQPRVFKTSRVALIMEVEAPDATHHVITLTKTPSLSSSASTASRDSRDSKPGACCPNIQKSQGASSPRSHPAASYTCKSQDIILFQSTNVKRHLFSQRLNFNGSPVKLNAASQGGLESRRRVLPMIILTPPDDENDYCTVSPFNLGLFCPYSMENAKQKDNLPVPTAPLVKDMETARKRRQYPHPAGPWLRPLDLRGLRVNVTKHTSSKGFSSSSSLRGQLDWQWKDGCRNAEGTVIGWQKEFIQLAKQNSLQKNRRRLGTKPQETIALRRKADYSAVLSFPPPRLPSEREIQQRQLQFNIENSLRLGSQVNRKRFCRSITFPSKVS